MKKNKEPNTEKVGKARGFMLANFIYLILFYVVYFIIVPTVLYFRATICALDLFTTYCAAIPTSTTGMMDFILFVVVPIGALLFTIWSSKEPQYVAYQQ